MVLTERQPTAGTLIGTEGFGGWDEMMIWNPAITLRLRKGESCLPDPKHMTNTRIALRHMHRL